MKLEDFDYYLPDELIAQTPLQDRAASRLMVLNKQTGEIEHKIFSDIIHYLNPGDCLVLNDTKVMPARLFGMKEDTNAHVEVLLLKQIEGDKWETLVKPAKRIKPGTVISFGGGKLHAKCIDTLEYGGRIFEFQYDGIFYEILDELGKCRCLHILKNGWMMPIAIKPSMPGKSVLRQHQPRDFTLLKNC